MNKLLVGTLLIVPLFISVESQAKQKKGKHSPEHNAAVKKCNDDYGLALKVAQGKRGADRAEAKEAAKKVREACLSQTPL